MTGVVTRDSAQRRPGDKQRSDARDTYNIPTLVPTSPGRAGLCRFLPDPGPSTARSPFGSPPRPLRLLHENGHPGARSRPDPPPNRAHSALVFESTGPNIEPGRSARRQRRDPAPGQHGHVAAFPHICSRPSLFPPESHFGRLHPADRPFCLPCSRVSTRRSRHAIWVSFTYASNAVPIVPPALTRHSLVHADDLTDRCGTYCSRSRRRHKPSNPLVLQTLPERNPQPQSPETLVVHPARDVGGSRGFLIIPDSSIVPVRPP